MKNESPFRRPTGVGFLPKLLKFSFIGTWREYSISGMAQLLTRSCSLQILLAMAQIEMTAIKRYSSYFLVT